MSSYTAAAAAAPTTITTCDDLILLDSYCSNNSLRMLHN